MSFPSSPSTVREEEGKKEREKKEEDLTVASFEKGKIGTHPVPSSASHRRAAAAFHKGPTWQSKKNKKREMKNDTKGNSEEQLTSRP